MTIRKTRQPVLQTPRTTLVPLAESAGQTNKLLASVRHERALALPLIAMRLLQSCCDCRCLHRSCGASSNSGIPAIQTCRAGALCVAHQSAVDALLGPLAGSSAGVWAIRLAPDAIPAQLESAQNDQPQIATDESQAPADHNPPITAPATPALPRRRIVRPQSESQPFIGLVALLPSTLVNALAADPLAAQLWHGRSCEEPNELVLDVFVQPAFCGHGLATEAAKRILMHHFAPLSTESTLMAPAATICADPEWISDSADISPPHTPTLSDRLLTLRFEDDHAAKPLLLEADDAVNNNDDDGDTFCDGWSDAAEVDAAIPRRPRGLSNPCIPTPAMHPSHRAASLSSIDQICMLHRLQQIQQTTTHLHDLSASHDAIPAPCGVVAAVAHVPATLATPPLDLDGPAADTVATTPAARVCEKLGMRPSSTNPVSVAFATNRAVAADLSHPTQPSLLLDFWKITQDEFVDLWIGP